MFCLRHFPFLEYSAIRAIQTIGSLFSSDWLFFITDTPGVCLQEEEKQHIQNFSKKCTFLNFSLVMKRSFCIVDHSTLINCFAPLAVGNEINIFCPHKFQKKLNQGVHINIHLSPQKF